MKRPVLAGPVLLALFAWVLATRPKQSSFVYRTSVGTKVTPVGSAPTPWYVALDGYDKAADITFQTINVWKDYNDRTLG